MISFYVGITELNFGKYFILNVVQVMHCTAANFFKVLTNCHLLKFSNNRFSAANII